MTKLARTFGSVVLLVTCACGGGSGADGPSDGGQDAQVALDWHTSGCSELGGVTTPTNACLVECGECPTAQLRCMPAPGMKVNVCVIQTCAVDSDCGPSGWFCRDNGFCALTCTTVTSGQSSECPSDWHCYAPDFGTDRAPYCVSGTSSTGGCGNCGTDNAGGCCGGVFCAGACAGSPCCS